MVLQRETRNTDSLGDSGGQSRFPQIAKCLKGCKDPVVAASKIRKATMRDVGDLESKADRGKQICRDVIGLFQDDFDSEERGLRAVGLSDGLVLCFFYNVYNCIDIYLYIYIYFLYVYI